MNMQWWAVNNERKLIVGWDGGRKGNYQKNELCNWHVWKKDCDNGMGIRLKCWVDKVMKAGI